MNKKVIKPLFLLSFAFCLAFLPPLATFAEEDILSTEESDILESCTENAIDIWSDSKLRRYAEDNILYYDDQFKDSCDHAEEPEPENPCTPILQGSNLEEKIWNWIATAGISGVSDNSAAIAGIIGNFNVETGGTYDPFIVGGGGGNYYGFFQTNNVGLRDAFSSAGIGEYWGRKDVPEDVIDKAIDVTLDYLFHNFGHTPSFLTHLDQVSYTTGSEGAKSYAELFLVAVERGVNGKSMLEDPKVQNFVNTILYPSNPKLHNNGYQATSRRRDAAETIYNKYATGTVPGTPSEECTPNEGPIIPGGSPKEAQEIMDLYRKAAQENPDLTDSSFSADCKIGTKGYIRGDCTYAGGFVNDGGCAYGTFNNCSAFSQWFVNKYWGANLHTNPAIGCGVQGSQIVDTLTSEKCHYGYTKSKIPRVGAVVSMGPQTGTSADNWPNHTGVVLGIDTENDLIIIGEASCKGGYTDTIPGLNSVLRGGAASYKLSKWNNASANSIYGPKYAYKEGFNLYGE